jgi:ABC-type bacteriocin/lantibiotic exporter with double-glycine peptidase domain
MQPIIQEDRTGCGIASVATLEDMSYHHVKTTASRLGIDVKNAKLWSDTKHIRQLLTYYGLSTSPRKKPFKSWWKLPPLALFAIKWHIQETQAFWYWVIFCRGSGGMVALDPKPSLKKHVCTDLGKMKPKWLIAVGTKGSLWTCISRQESETLYETPSAY